MASSPSEFGDHRTTESLVAAKLEEIRALRADCLGAEQQLETSRPSPAHVLQTAQSTVDNISLITTTSEENLNSLCEIKNRRLRDYRWFQENFNLDRDAEVPDPITTTGVASLCIVIEGTMAGGMMIMDGKMGITAGLTYGWIFAGTNILVGLVTGFFSRYLNIKNITVRRLTKFGLVLSTGFLMLLIFSAARIRAIGSHTGIFDFSRVDFLSTFDDGITLVIMALGAIGSLIAIYEGIIGISDSIPGFTKMRHRCEKEISIDGRNAYEDGIDAVEDCAENAQDVINEFNEDIDELKSRTFDVSQQRRDYNNFVLACKDSVKVFASQRARIEGMPLEDINLTAFDKLLFSSTYQPDRLTMDMDDTLTESLNKITTARDKATTKIRAAYAQFQTLTGSMNLNSNRKED